MSKIYFRIGTCGVVSPEVNAPYLILASSAFSESNFAYTYNFYKEHNNTYPTKELNDIIESTSKELNYKLYVGDITTLDVFDPYIDYDRINRMPSNLNVIGEEMEAFGLFHIASSFNREASCILTAVDSKFSDVILTCEQR